MVSQIKEHIEVVEEEVENEGSDYFQQTLGRAHTRRSSTHNKRKEDGSN